ncbi:CoA-binding protein [Streptomyces sp. PTM05]|uniref:CoA-binding protein n=1 Tax=Streptantibioticus parmotrematis TaxID=2873249 RepID=A0ABS7QLJ6_9ACTN|nr:CoA-binding protein [Streptantibioticus parmotrematis]MBY8883245.1 CoA-binding protein [Streptantibioticus parmotrematis]
MNGTDGRQGGRGGGVPGQGHGFGGDEDGTVRRILTATGDTWAVVGLSGNERRAAYGVARTLQRYGKRIVPVHPKAETVHGERGYASLAEIPFPVDVVDVFVNSDLAGGVADEAVAIGARAVWFQLGVIDEAAYERTRAAGLEMVMDRCPAIEIPRLGLPESG